MHFNCKLINAQMFLCLVSVSFFGNEHAFDMLQAADFRYCAVADLFLSFLLFFFHFILHILLLYYSIARLNCLYAKRSHFHDVFVASVRNHFNSQFMCEMFDFDFVLWMQLKHPKREFSMIYWFTGWLTNAAKNGDRRVQHPTNCISLLLFFVCPKSQVIFFLLNMICAKYDPNWAFDSFFFILGCN